MPSLTDIRASRTAKTDADWWCAGCGTYSPDRRRVCSCMTDVVFRIRNDDIENEVKEGDMLTVKRSAGNPRKGYCQIECLPHEKDGKLCQGACSIPVVEGASEVSGTAMRWGWNGSEDHPTITPSYACQECGLHVTITSGIENGRPKAAE